MKFFEKKRFCVLCKKYLPDSKMGYIHKEIGMCASCIKELTKLNDNSFEGPGGIKAVFAAFLYEGAIREAVKAFKFSGQELYGELFGKILAEKLRNIDSLCTCDMIIPVPLHEKRLSERGYNQSEILAQELANKLHVPMFTDVLFRIKETQKQSSLKGLMRVENVQGAFWAHEESVRGKKIALVDDICTMGETLKACERALKASGAVDVYGVALCITPEKHTSFKKFD